MQVVGSDSRHRLLELHFRCLLWAGLHHFGNCESSSDTRGRAAADFFIIISIIISMVSIIIYYFSLFCSTRIYLLFRYCFYWCLCVSVCLVVCCSIPLFFFILVLVCCVSFLFVLFLGILLSLLSVVHVSIILTGLLFSFCLFAWVLVYFCMIFIFIF